MICYMPYSFISPGLLNRLCVLFPEFTVYAPAENLLTEPMRRMEHRGLMKIRFPQGVDSARLQRVINDFDAWVDLHRGDMESLRDFFRISRGAPPLVNETDVTQISTQIRHFETPAGNSSNGESLFQASLFLALAHRYDAQQEALGSELGTIQEMEQRMFARMSGKDDAAGPMDMDVIAPAGDIPVPGDADYFMVDQRLRAWATLAAADPEPAWAYVTSSQQVLESLLEVFPETIKLAHYQLAVPQAGCENFGEMVPDLPALLKKLAFSKDMKAETLTLPEQTVPRPSESDLVQLRVFGLPDCTPRRALARMQKSGGRANSDAPHGLRPVHTLLGYVARSQ